MNNDEEGDLGLQQGDNKVVLINFINPDDWTKVVENNKVYYYYNYKLSPNETTSELLDSVTFNAAITNDYNCVESDTDTSKTMKCKSTGNGYDGATYKLTFNIETIQYNKYKNACGTNVEIAEARPDPEPETGVNGVEFLMENALNESSATYNNQTKSKMFVFNHAATTQTPALTDYRYIGDSPDNYVKFNCDNDGTNCEIWRIIGVFDVDDGSENYEKRIKIVRNSELPDKRQWDNKDADNEYSQPSDPLGKNEWNESKIELFLNEQGDYYNRNETAINYGLKDSAKLMIGDAKFYLGHLKYNYSSNHYGSADTIYASERGIEVYNKNGAQRSINWTGKVGLAYSSDFAYIYGKNVVSGCYNDPSTCYIYGEKNWMRNLDSDGYGIWLLSSELSNPISVL